MLQGQSTATILLVEADPSLRRLITLGLAHSGMHVIETDSLDNLPALQTCSIDLLVLDVDRGVVSDWSLLERVQAHPLLAPLPTVLLAWECAPMTALALVHSALGNRQISRSTHAGLLYLDKPFDARALHQTIEQLLQARAEQKAALIASAEARLLATYAAQHVAPSIWPAVTAAGTLLAVIGLLWQMVLLVIGILIVMLALLLWTLGTKNPSARSSVAYVAVGVGKP